MTCKYYDCGFCYAPADAKNNSIQGGCFEPEYCATYLMQNKPMMTEKEHLECEIKELELEIKKHNEAIQNLNNIKERRTQKLKEMNNTQKNTNEAVENKLKEENDYWIKKLQDHNFNVAIKNANYPMVEVVDENTVKIEGVEYKKVEKPKPQTLLEIIREWNDDDDNPPCEILVDMIKKEWLPDEMNDDGEEYHYGWNDCLNEIKKNLR